MRLEIEQIIKVISSSTSKSVKVTDDIVSVSSKEMKEAEGNSIQVESTSEMVNEDDTGGIANCLINVNFDKGPKVPRKRDPIVDDSESEDSSQDIDSDEEDIRSDKRKTSIDRRQTKRVKSGTPATGRAYNAPPQFLQAPSANQG